MTISVDICVDKQALVGEGPIWDEKKQVLYWIDILSSKLYRYNPAKGKNKSYDVGQHVGTVVLRESGGFMLALRNGFAAFDAKKGKLEIINDPESHLTGNRFNDGKCDPAGRFWAGTMAYDNPVTQGSLYRMNTDFEVRKMVGGIGISNGIVWSHDQKSMYYIDTIAATVRAYDYDLDTGDISNERVAIDVPREMGLPDGMTIDTDGMLWIAHYGGGRVCQWNPETAEVLQTIEVPAKQTTACAFGGKKLDTLYITSAAQQMSKADLKKEPHAGALFACKPGAQGVNAFRFGG